MYNSVIYQRLKTLIEYEGFTLADGSVIKGEVMGYLAGLTLLQEQLNTVLRESLVPTAEKQGLSVLLHELNLEMAGSAALTREKILNRLSQPYGAFSASLFNSALHAACGTDAAYTVNGGALRLQYTPADPGGMAALGNFLQEWVAPFLTVSLSGDGQSWDMFDAQASTCNQLDGMNCPFSVLDTR